MRDILVTHIVPYAHHDDVPVSEREGIHIAEDFGELVSVVYISCGIWPISGFPLYIVETLGILYVASTIHEGRIRYLQYPRVELSLRLASESRDVAHCLGVDIRYDILRCLRIERTVKNKAIYALI